MDNFMQLLVVKLQGTFFAKTYLNQCILLKPLLAIAKIHLEGVHSLGIAVDLCAHQVTFLLLHLLSSPPSAPDLSCLIASQVHQCMLLKQLLLVLVRHFSPIFLFSSADFFVGLFVIGVSQEAMMLTNDFKLIDTYLFVVSLGH